MSMTTPTPTPGQPLSEADVSLLQPGDWLRHERGPIGTFKTATSSHIFMAREGLPDIGDYVSGFTFLGRPDQDGWIAWSGGEKPVSGLMVDYMLDGRYIYTGILSDEIDWFDGDEPIIAYRPHAPVSRPGDGVEGAPVRADDAARVHAPEMERSAENQRPKTRDWRDLRLVRFDGTDLYQWRGKQKDSIFEDQASEVFALTPPAEPVSRPAGEGEREAVARIIREEYDRMIVAGDDRRDNADRASDRILSLLRPATPDAGGGDDRLRTLADRVVAEVKRGASGSSVQALGALSNIEEMVLSALQPRGER